MYFPCRSRIFTLMPPAFFLFILAVLDFREYIVIQNGVWFALLQWHAPIFSRFFDVKNVFCEKCILALMQLGKKSYSPLCILGKNCIYAFMLCRRRYVMLLYFHHRYGDLLNHFLYLKNLDFVKAVEQGNVAKVKNYLETASNDLDINRWVYCMFILILIDI